MHNWKRTLWVVFFAQVVSATGFSVMFPFLPVYVQQLGTRSGLSLEFWAAMSYSGQAITMALVSPFWGSVADRYGHKLMLERATFGGALILGAMALVGSAEELALLRAIQGLITGTIAAASALVAAIAPRERLGYAMGVLQVGLWVGIAVGPLIGGLIADAVGFRATFILTGVLLAISGVVIWFGIHEPRPTAQQAARRNVTRVGWRSIVASPGVALVYAVRFLSQIGQTMLLPILPLFILALLPQASGVNTLTGLTVGISSLTATLSAIYLGKLGDRVGHRVVLIVSLLGAALCYLPQGLVSSIWQLLLLQALSGVAVGGVIPSMGALLARYTPPGSEGAVYGIDNSVAAASRAVAPLIGAGVASLLGMRAIFTVIGVSLLATALLAAGLPKLAPVAEPGPAYD